MSRIETQQSFKDVTPAVEMNLGGESAFNKEVGALLANRASGSMQSRLDSVALVEIGTLGKVMLVNDYNNGDAVVLAQAITKCPPGPRPPEPVREPADGRSTGPGSVQVPRRPGC